MRVAFAFLTSREAVEQPADGEQQHEGDDIDDPAGELVKETVGDLRAIVAREYACAADARGVGHDGDGHGGEDDDRRAPEAVTLEPSEAPNAFVFVARIGEV